jgi:hypothetical protein
VLQNSISHFMVLIPLGIALFFSIVRAIPILIFRSRHKVQGIRGCLWVLIQLWVHLIITYLFFLFDKPQAYVWALHSASYILTTWQSKRDIYPGFQRLASLLGVWCVGLFAWQFGPPVGLAAWYSKSDAQCGWKVHLTAVLGVELVESVLWPWETLVIGLI